MCPENKKQEIFGKTPHKVPQGKGEGEMRQYTQSAYHSAWHIKCTRYMKTVTGSLVLGEGRDAAHVKPNP